MFKKVALLASASLPLLASSAYATDVTDTLDLQATIVASCAVTVGANINFGGAIVTLANPINQSSSVDVLCSNGTPYTVGIDFGLNGNRVLSDGASHTIEYELYTDAGFSTIFPTISASSIGATGDGVNPDTYDIYAQIPSQTTPVNGTYTDTVTVAVRY